MDRETFVRIAAEIKLYGDLGRQLGQLADHVVLCTNPQCRWSNRDVELAFGGMVDQGTLITGMLELYLIRDE